MRKEELDIFIKQAVEGDKIALEKVLMEVNDFVFNLSLRMLGNISDAQDATQDFNEDYDEIINFSKSITFSYLGISSCKSLFN